MTSRILRITFALGLLASVRFARAEDAAIKQLLEQLRPVTVSERTLHSMAGKDGFKPYVLNPIMVCGKRTHSEWDAGALGTACVIKVKDVYHLYYEAWGVLTEAGKPEEYDTLQIGHAVSLDGLHWAKDPANPVIRRGTPDSWDAQGTWDPFVIYEEGKFKMWFGGNKGKQCEWAYAESTDGTHFNEHGPISHLGAVEDIHVVHDAATREYRLYYWDRDKAPWDDVMKGPPGQPSGLFVARSKNEIDFDFDNAQRLSVEGQEWPVKYSHVLPYHDKWVMFYGDAVVRGKPSRTGMAFSDDGFEWTSAAFPIVTGHDAEVVEAAPGLWLIFYGPHSYFDWPEGDLNVAVYEGPLENLAKKAK